MKYSTLPELGQMMTIAYDYESHLSSRWEQQWTHYSSGQLRSMIRATSLALKARGLSKGDCVGLVGPTCAEWVIIDLAIMSCGAVSVPMFDHMTEDSFCAQLDNSEARTFFAIGEDALRFLERFEEKVETIISLRSAGKLQWETLLAEGRENDARDPALFDQLIGAVLPDDLATIVYTSGSTGVPKGVELTHRAMVQQLQDLLVRFPCYPNDDVMLTGLPLAHVLTRMISYSCIAGGVQMAYLPDIKEFAAAAKERVPTITTAVPRLLEKIYLNIKEKIMAGSGLKKRLGLAALGLARRPSLNWWQRLLHPIFDRLVYRKFREALGGRIRIIGSGAAPLDPKLGGFYWHIGMPVCHGYGASECCSAVTVNTLDMNRHGTVGPPYPSYELRLAETGELLVRGPSLMRGYHKRPDLTAEVIDADGWYHTGDIATIDADGYLTITGRIKEIMKTSGGKIITPVPLEHALANAPLIDMAMVVAEGRKCVGALLVPDRQELQRFKREHGLAERDDDAVLCDPAFHAATAAILERVNKKFVDYQRVRKVRWLPEALSVEGGELTPTLKIRRPIVEQKYATLIDGMYEP